MAGMKIKKGDTVLIRSGKDKGKTGTVLSLSRPTTP
jgi:ribosomal protein L24